jgi:hypothetical protein
LDDIEGRNVYRLVRLTACTGAAGSSHRGAACPSLGVSGKRYFYLFPYAAHAEIVWCVERIGTAVIRDITITGGNSFGSWLVTKVWIDEMVWYLAEKGAFMKLKMTIKTTQPPAPVSASTGLTVANMQPMLAAPVAGANHGHDGAWAPMSPSASNPNFLQQAQDQDHYQSAHHQHAQQPSPLQQFTTVNPRPSIDAGSNCVPFEQSAPMPASAAPQNNNIDVNTSMSMSMSMSMNDGASVVDSTHDDSGIGSEEDFKLDRLSVPRDHLEQAHPNNGI